MAHAGRGGMLGGLSPAEAWASKAVVRRVSAAPVRMWRRQGWMLLLEGARAARARDFWRRGVGTGVGRKARVVWREVMAVWRVVVDAEEGVFAKVVVVVVVVVAMMMLRTSGFMACVLK